MVLSVCACAPGCRSGNCDLVEAELRTREGEIRAMRSEMAKAAFMNDALAREVEVLRQQGPGKLSPEQAALTFNVKEITLTRQTGGIDLDHKPGDDALQVAFEPRDGDGHSIKAPGSLHVLAQEVDQGGVKTPLSTWEVSPEEVRRSWKDGLFTKGYQIVLPWKTWPNSEHIRVTVRFTTPDGRLFEADRDVTVRLTPAAQRKPVPGPILFDAPPGSTMQEPILLPMPKTSASNKPPSPGGASWPAPAPAPPQMLANSMWKPLPAPNLAESIELGRPIPIADPVAPQVNMFAK
jgi:hypothetical protein